MAVLETGISYPKDIDNTTIIDDTKNSSKNLAFIIVDMLRIHNNSDI